MNNEQIFVAIVPVALAAVGHLAKTLYELSRVIRSDRTERRNRPNGANGQHSTLEQIREIAFDAATHGATAASHDIREHVSECVLEVRDRLEKHDRNFDIAMASLARTEDRQTMLLEQQARLLERLLDRAGS